MMILMMMMMIIMIMIMIITILLMMMIIKMIRMVIIVLIMIIILIIMVMLMMMIYTSSLIIDKYWRDSFRDRKVIYIYIYIYTYLGETFSISNINTCLFGFQRLQRFTDKPKIDRNACLSGVPFQSLRQRVFKTSFGARESNIHNILFHTKRRFLLFFSC